ncbi:MAG: metallophosphoesterase [Phycisphaerales bacterium]
MTNSPISRRTVLAAGGAALASTALWPARARGAASLNSASAAPSLHPRRVLRLAHMTDTHIQPERAGSEGFAAALAHMQGQADRPDLVLFGGENLMNVDSGDGAARAAVQVAEWTGRLRQDLSLPHRCCIGNHDVLRLDPGDGKRFAADLFGMPGRYYAFDPAEAAGLTGGRAGGRGAWRVVVLDSTSPEGGGYKGRLDDEQFEWLDATLGEIGDSAHVLVLSHIPILAPCAYFDGENERSGDWVVPGAWMHIDARRIKDVFLKHANVRLCLSGHMHLVDQASYNGVWYCCNGAVSGAWWGGAYHEFNTGYGLVDLFEDGTFRNEYVTYPWEPRE